MPTQWYDFEGAPAPPPNVPAPTGYYSGSTTWPTWTANAPVTSASSYVWTNWVTTTTSGTSYLAEPQAWANWINLGTTGGIDVSAWNEWQVYLPPLAGYTPPGVYRGEIRADGSVAYPSPEPETDEQRAAREARQRRGQLISRNRGRARQLRTKFAERRAEELLLEYLDERQAEEWRVGRSFHVETADGRRRYRIAYGTAGNVRLVRCAENPLSSDKRNAGRIREGATFCMHVYHPDGRIPAQDNVLAQLLLIQTDEEQFLTGANIS